MHHQITADHDPGVFRLRVGAIVASQPLEWVVLGEGDAAWVELEKGDIRLPEDEQRPVSRHQVM